MFETLKYWNFKNANLKIAGDKSWTKLKSYRRSTRIDCTSQSRLIVGNKLSKYFNTNRLINVFQKVGSVGLLIRSHRSCKLNTWYTVKGWMHIYFAQLSESLAWTVSSIITFGESSFLLPSKQFSSLCSSFYFCCYQNPVRINLVITLLSLNTFTTYLPSSQLKGNLWKFKN